MAQRKDTGYRRDREIVQVVPRTVDGVVVPHDLHAEAGVLSVILGSPGTEASATVFAALGTLRPEHFYSEPHRWIFTACLALKGANSPVDNVTVMTWLRDCGRLEAVGGPAYINDILGGVLDVVPRNVGSYAAIVIERARRRAIIGKLQEAAARAYLDGETFAELLTSTQRDLESFEGELAGLRLEECLPAEDGDDSATNHIIPALKIGPGRATLFAGDAYTGKTLALLELALAIATGAFDVWGAHRVAETGKVLWLNYEAPKKGWRNRLRRMLRSHKLSREDIAGKFVVSHHPELFLDDDEGETQFTAAVRGFKICVIDSLVASVKHTQEKDEEMGRVILKLLRISDKTGCTFILVHHTTKPPQTNGRPGARGADVRDAKDAIRGSRSILGACDGVFVLISGGKRKPVRIVHEKSIDDTIDDQYLRFCDEEMITDTSGGSVLDPKWGLYCEHIPVEQMAALRQAESKQRESGIDASAAFDQFCERLLELVKAHPGSSGAELKNRMVKVSKDRLYGGLKALAKKGSLVAEKGPRNAEIWRAT